LDTEPATLAPSDSARALASLRLIFSGYRWDDRLAAY
jgi:hypothetical protein